jgi:hypothetical protein
MVDDHIYPPEDERPFNTQKNAHCSKDMWRPQEDLLEEDQMRDPDWYPKDTYYNIYQKDDFNRREDAKRVVEQSR